MSAVRWGARILGIVGIGFVSIFVVGQGIDEGFPFNLTGVELAMMSGLFTALIGMGVLWKWEGIGGAMVVLGMTAFFLVNLMASGSLGAGLYFPLFFIPGVLALISWWHHRNQAPLKLSAE